VWDTSSDYVTHFRVTGRRADSLRALLIEEEAPRPRWNAMIALVTNNDDPEGMGRVKVKFPWLSTDIESDWARLIGLGAGDQRGLCILPEVNDEVLVVFAQGDIAQPLVIGGLWNGSDALPASSGEIVAGGQVKQRLFVTRAGHKLTFSDENSAAITLETAGGHKVLLDDDAAKIEITGSGGNKIVLDENGRKLTIEGIGDVQIEASMNLTVKSSANMNLEAGGTMTIKGAVVQLN
jgi:uncharacterized protein involved in type VI secretion and phage assembly